MHLNLMTMMPSFISLYLGSIQVVAIIYNARSMDLSFSYLLLLEETVAEQSLEHVIFILGIKEYVYSFFVPKLLYGSNWSPMSNTCHVRFPQCIHT